MQIKLNTNFLGIVCPFLSYYTLCIDLECLDTHYSITLPLIILAIFYKNIVYSPSKY